MDLLLPLVLGCVVLFLVCYIYYAVAKYGEDTSLGFSGTLVLAIFTSPVVAFLIILVFLKRR